MTEEEQGNPYAKRLTKKERQILDNLPEGSYIQALQRDAQGIPIFTPEQETALRGIRIRQVPRFIKDVYSSMVGSERLTLPRGFEDIRVAVVVLGLHAWRPDAFPTNPKGVVDIAILNGAESLRTTLGRR